VIAVDTNLLVHAHRREASMHGRASAALRELAESPQPWAICFHSLMEFYAVVTHPRLWKKASSPAQALDQIAAWRESPGLRLLADSEEVFEAVAELVIAGEVRGGLVYDARIAACCQAHGVREIWTIDRDFSRFPGLQVRNPLI